MGTSRASRRCGMARAHEPVLHGNMPSAKVNQQLWHEQWIDLLVALCKKLVVGFLRSCTIEETYPLVVGNNRVVDFVKVSNA